MLFSGNYITRASGSLGDVVASHNRGGQYLRERIVPTDPNTARQQAVRSCMTTVSQRYRITLSNEQRDGWHEYSREVSHRNALGARIQLTGQQTYVRSNLLRCLVGLATVDDAPTLYVGAEMLVFADLTNTLGQLTFTRSPIAGGDTVVYAVSDAVPTDSRSYHGSWRIATEDSGTPTTPVADPWNLSAGVGQWVKTVVLSADGRVSEPSIHGPYPAGF